MKMKTDSKLKTLILGVTLGVCSALNGFGQSTVRTHATLEVDREDSHAFITRHDRDMQNYFQENAKLESKDCDVLFLGSSSINVWSTIYDDMAPMKIIRRSYGGSAIRDMIYNYDIIARDFNPKAIVLYCENDITGGKEDITALEIIDLFRVFISKLQTEYEGIPIFLIGIKPSPARGHLLPLQTRVNQLFQDFVSTTDGVEYIDLPTLMMQDPKGSKLDPNNIRQDIWTKDRLHMNAKGYEIWTKTLKPRLLEVVKK